MDMLALKLDREIAAARHELLLSRGVYPQQPRDPLEMLANPETLRFVLSTKVNVSDLVIRIDRGARDGIVTIRDPRTGLTLSFTVTEGDQ